MYNFEQFDGLQPGQLNTFARQRFRDLIENPVRLGERVLPFSQVDDYKIAVGRVSFRNIASAIIAPDSELPRGPLGTFEEREFLALKTGLKYGLKESEIRKLREVYKLGKVSGQQLLRTQPYQLANSLTLAYLDRVEAMRWQALAQGAIDLKGGAQVVYDIPATHQAILAGTDLWSDAANADGLQDLIDWDDQVYQDTGGHLQVIFMSRTAFNNLLAQAATKSKINNRFGSIGNQVAGTPRDLTAGDINVINQFLALYGIGPIRLYDRQYDEFDFTAGNQPVRTRFLPEDRVVGIAPTPVEGSLQPGVGQQTATGYTAEAPVVENGFEPGLYVWFRERDEPYEVFVKSVGWALPIITDGNTLVQAKVL